MGSSLLPSLTAFQFAAGKTTETTTMASREQLREQHELTQEIGNAITSMPITEPIDEDELEADLAALEQESVDEKMLKTGTMPVADSLSRLPKAANGEREFTYPFHLLTIVERKERKSWTNEAYSQGQIESAGRRGRRGGGTAETAGGNGDVRHLPTRGGDRFILLFFLNPIVGVTCITPTITLF